ncbi:MAG: hypothetical protein FWG93_06350 [Oscillospiraceae bacterium]|nr:hypothetical protein [Oscillospiraceae bacterium]
MPTAKQRPVEPNRSPIPKARFSEPPHTDAIHIASATDFTGLIPAGDPGQETPDAYAEFYPFEDDDCG